MKYISTRGLRGFTFLDALRAGLAPDGGLFVPAAYPRCDMTAMKNYCFRGVAGAVLDAFAPDIPALAREKIVASTYNSTNFPGEDVAPLWWFLPQNALLSLSEGPTQSFKDMAMQLVSRLMAWDLEQRGERLTLVVATSGDTGGSAVHAFAGIPQVTVVVLYPHERVSEYQRRQMTTKGARNVVPVAVRGTFDDCQAIVKAISNDTPFKQRYRISGVNSINWARIMAQVMYWLWAAIQVRQQGGMRPTFAVPSGNFGNALAAYITTRMGVEADILVCTNENDVLDTAIRTGVYKPRASAEVVATTSPSMDISVASNFERIVFDLIGRDSLEMGVLLQKLSLQGSFALDSTLFAQAGIMSGSANQFEVKETMRRMYTERQIMVDPHSAVALAVVAKMPKLSWPVVVAETARPIKFAEAVHAATGVWPVYTAEQEAMMRAPEDFTVVDADVEAVKEVVAKA